MRIPTLDYGDVVATTPQLARGRVWCTSCGATRTVNPATCLQYGWPLCCGHTMTVDSPEERAAREATDDA